MSHANQHFVPTFLLRGWHSGSDLKLSHFEWLMRGKLQESRYKAQSVAKMPHLYSLNRDTSVPDVRVERDYLGPEVDAPASLALGRMLQEGVRALTPEDFTNWSRFLVSLMLRSPSTMERIRGRGRDILMRSVDQSVDGHEQIGVGDTYPSLKEWVMNECPEEFDNLGARSLPMLVDSEVLNGVIRRAHWATRPITSIAPDLLIGDRPLIQDGSLQKSYLLALPISPRCLFVAFNDAGTWDNLCKKSSKQLVRETNHAIVTQAERYVYSTGSQHLPLIRKHLARS